MFKNQPAHFEKKICIRNSNYYTKNYYSNLIERKKINSKIYKIEYISEKAAERQT